MWKQSNIVPIPKSGDEGNPTNYRPISLLPVLSKLLERHIANLVLLHLMITQQIFASQWGFQCGKSTITINKLLSANNTLYVFKKYEGGRKKQLTLEVSSIGIQYEIQKSLKNNYYVQKAGNLSSTMTYLRGGGSSQKVERPN